MGRREQMDLLGKVVLSFGLAQQNDCLTLLPKFNNTGFALTFMAGRDEDWQEICFDWFLAAEKVLLQHEKKRGKRA